MFNIKKYKFPILITAIIFGIIFYSVAVRMQGLGYSNFQGDEVNTVDFMYEMKPGIQGLWEYLTAQKRGPVQYVLNIINYNIFGYQDEWLIRFPYLITGILAIYTLYRLSKKIFDNETALIAALLIGANGLFIAFARITQYQSIMYFLVPIGIYMFINGLKDRESNKKLFFSALIMSLAFLTHYDTLSTIPFFVAGFIGYYFRLMKSESGKSDGDFNFIGLFRTIGKNKSLLKEMLLRMALFFGAFLLPALIYYVPFYMGQAFEEKTSGYLENRLFGGGFMPRTKITLKLLTMYVPEFHLNFLLVAGVIGGIFIGGNNLGAFKLGKFRLSKKQITSVFVFFALLILFASIFSLYPVKPRSSSLLVIGSSLTVASILTFYRKVRWEHAALAAWFFGAYSFYFFVMKDPRTHVYVSMIPLFILAAFGISEFYKSLKINWIRNSLMSFFLLSILFVSGVNWMIFVDRNPEYPWWDKDFMGWKIYEIKRVRHEKIEGVFGFNNYRAWEQVKTLYDRGCLEGAFNSNEKNSISYFYTRFDQKQKDNWGFEIDADTLIVVEGPHSWEYYDHVKLQDRSDYSLLHQIYSNDFAVTHIYGKNSVYTDGELLCKE